MAKVNEEGKLLLDSFSSLEVVVMVDPNTINISVGGKLPVVCMSTAARMCANATSTDSIDGLPAVDGFRAAIDNIDYAEARATYS